jgi:epoxyqueuosine reductase QueG
MNSSDIKKQTAGSGAKVCGIAPIDRFTDAPKGFGPLDLFPRTRSAIAFAMQVPKSSLNLPTSIPYTVNELMSLHESHRVALELTLFIEANGYEAVIVPSEPYEYWDIETSTGKGLVSLKHIAQRCGLGVWGKNHLLYNPQLGNLMRLGAVLTNAELKPDAMIEKIICKSNCQLCISNCPGGAISETGVKQMICREFSQRTTSKGDHVYACNLCRRICPNLYGFAK